MIIWIIMVMAEIRNKATEEDTRQSKQMVVWKSTTPCVTLLNLLVKLSCIIKVQKGMDGNVRRGTLCTIKFS